MRIIGVDHDGPLVPGRMHLLPGPQAIERAYRADEIDRAEYYRRMPFDPVAVLLLNRLCERADAKIVVISHWRRHMDAAGMRAKYKAEGVEERHLHPRMYAHVRGETKATDISWWLQDNRVKPGPAGRRPRREIELPPAPPDSASDEAYRKTVADYDAAYRDHGVDVLVLDDDASDIGDAHRDVHLPIDYDRGLDKEYYRIALGHFRGVDPELGVPAVSDADFELALSAHRGRRIAALTFLHGSVWPHHGSVTRATVLHEATVAPTLGESLLFGDTGSMRRRAAESIRSELRERIEANRKADEAHDEELRNRPPISADF